MLMPRNCVDFVEQEAGPVFRREAGKSFRDIPRKQGRVPAEGSQAVVRGQTVISGTPTPFKLAGH